MERQRVDHRTHVEAGAADEQRPLAAGGDVGDRVTRRLLEANDRPVLGRARHVDEVMRQRGAVGHGRLGGADVEAPVDLHRVDRHDLHVTERAGDREGERGLTGGSGTNEREMRRAITQART